jgi:hypothetical protein
MPLFYHMGRLQPPHTVRMSRKRGPPDFLLTKKATWSRSPSSLLQRSRPNGSQIVPSPDGAEGLPGPTACPTSAAARYRVPSLSVRVALARPRQVKAAQEAREPGAGALVLALTGVADLSSRTGGS